MYRELQAHTPVYHLFEFPDWWSMEALYAEKDRLIELRDSQREDFSNRRDYERKLRTVSANIDMILGKNHEQEQQIEKEQNL